MKRLIILFGLFLLLPGFLYGSVDTASSGHILLSSFESASAHWRDVIVPYAKAVFIVLITMDLVLEFAPIAMSGQLEFGTIMTALFRKIMTIGFFLMLFQFSDWFASIPKSFAQIGDTASGTTVDPDNIIAAALSIVLALVKGLSLFHVADSIALFFSALVILMAFGLMAAHLIMVYVKIYVISALAPLVYSLAGLTQTRQIAYNPIMAIIKAGTELLLLKLFLGLSITMMHDFGTNVQNDDGSVFVMIIMSIVMASVVHMAPGIVEALFSGTVAQNSTAGFGTAASVSGGVAAGATSVAGGLAAVKAASSMASSQGATGMGKVSQTMKNLGGAAMDDIKRSMAGENRGGSMGGRMASSMDVKNEAQQAANKTKSTDKGVEL